MKINCNFQKPEINVLFSKFLLIVNYAKLNYDRNQECKKEIRQERGAKGS
jgi:hypothetical protein